MSPHAVQAAPRLSHKLPGMFLDPLFCPQLPPGVLAELALNILLCCAPSPSITALHAQDQRRETCALLTDIIAHLEAQFPAVKTALADSTLGLQPLRASDLRLAPALQGLCAALRVLYADPIRAIDFLRYAHAVLDEPTPLRPARDAQPLHPCVERSFDAPLVTALWFAGDTFLIDPPYPRDRGGWWGDWEALSFWCRLEAERVEADLRLLQLQPALFIDPFPTVVRQLQELGNDLWQRGLAADRQSARRIDELAAFCMLTSMWYGSALVDD